MNYDWVTKEFCEEKMELFNEGVILHNGKVMGWEKEEREEIVETGA